MNLQAYLDIQPEIKAAVEAGKPVTIEYMAKAIENPNK